MKADSCSNRLISSCRIDAGGIVWHSKLYNESLTPRATKMFSSKDNLRSSMNNLQTADMWTDSPWPARNNAAFISLNNFMERCNDVLELVQVHILLILTISISVLHVKWLLSATYSCAQTLALYFASFSQV